jgi:predicted ATPase
MQTLFPGRIVEAKTVDELVKLEIAHADRRADTISDVGFGISQILPILVQISVMPDRSTLIIEQPELHLHPSVQTKLAEVLAAASKSGRRFIVETHSEHFVRGLQLAISNDRAKARAKLRMDAREVRFLYIPEAPSAPMTLPVNEWGEFTEEWPTGFFDEAYRLSMQLLNNKMKILAAKAANVESSREDQ